jgi:DNA processing protein
MTTGNIDTTLSDTARDYLALQMTGDVGPIRLGRLIAHFGSARAVLSASMQELERVEGIGPRIARSIFASRGDSAIAEGVEHEIQRAAECGLRIICRDDPDYPEPLRSTPDPPICLYVRGRLRATDAVAIGIVGTRRCSHYGREQAVRFGEMLGGAGFTVISGLARGIDGDAHRGAMQAGGRTIAVLGNGLGSVYPPEHADLAEQMTTCGALISEFAVDAQPAPENFPRRNRIIAGLSLGIIVIEAGKGSGALITARLAHDYNREVFAVPGRVDRPASTAGVHGLIRDGQAKLITCLEDVLDELGDVGAIMARAEAADSPHGDSELSGDQQAGTGNEGAERAAHAGGAGAGGVMNLTGNERAVLDAIIGEIEDPETIAEATGLDLARVMAVLTSLQLKALVRQQPGPRFVARAAQRAARGKPV